MEQWHFGGATQERTIQEAAGPLCVSSFPLCSPPLLCWFVRLSSSESEMRLYFRFRIVFWLMNIFAGGGVVFSLGLKATTQNTNLFSERKIRLNVLFSCCWPLLKQTRQPVVSTRFAIICNQKETFAEWNRCLPPFFLSLLNSKLGLRERERWQFWWGHFVFCKLGSNFGTLWCFSLSNILTHSIVFSLIINYRTVLKIDLHECANCVSCCMINFWYIIFPVPSNTGCQQGVTRAMYI